MSALLPKTDNRKSDRLIMCIPVKSRIFADGLYSEVYESLTKNISETGMSIEITGLNKDAVYSLSSRKNKIDLLITLPELDIDIKAMAEIAWVGKREALHSKTEAGVKFTEFAFGGKDKLEAYLYKMRFGSIKKEMESFLNVNISSELISCNRWETIIKLGIEDLKGLIPERGKAFFVERAIVAKVDKLVKIFAKVPITNEMCEGHMPKFPVLPLGIAGWLLSQGGEILVSYIENKGNGGDSIKKLPVVCKTGPVSSRHKGYFFPGDTLLIVAVLKKQRLGISEVDTEAWLDIKKVIDVPSMMYVISQDEKLWR